MSMDICSNIGLAVTDDVNGVFTETISVDELNNGVTEFLNIQDNIEENSSSLMPSINCESQNPCDDSHQNKLATQTPEEHLCKCLTFPCSCKTLMSTPDAFKNEESTHDDNAKSLDSSASCSISLPPVSAMKGSREKRGAVPSVKLTVKWAPDVYDPIPTSVSHVVTNNKSSRHSKKNSKNKQKNSSKSSSRKGKEKKQVRKRGGRSSSSSSMGSYKLAEHEEDEVDFNMQEEPQIDFHHEQFCGSSFLKSHGTSMHLSSVAEAT